MKKKWYKNRTFWYSLLAFLALLSVMLSPIVLIIIPLAPFLFFGVLFYLMLANK